MSCSEIVVVVSRKTGKVQTPYKFHTLKEMKRIRGKISKKSMLDYYKKDVVGIVYIPTTRKVRVYQ